MRRPTVLRNAWFATRQELGSHRLSYRLLALAPAPYARVPVGPGTDVCIDGFPRSANTFAVYAFAAANPSLQLAHHMHAPMQLLSAARRDIPCALLVRDPLGTLTSLCVSVEGELSATLAYRAYIRFYRRVLPIAREIAVCAFDDVVADPTTVARRLNAKYGQSFSARRVESERDLRDQIAAEHPTGARRKLGLTVPHPDKERLKPATRTRLREHRLLRPAVAVHRELVQQAAT